MVSRNLVELVRESKNAYFYHSFYTLIFFCVIMIIIILLDSKTLLLAVHSDVPHEQQLLAFQPTQPDEVKIVIATNAAESSVTIPDVDHVICLGTSKILTYNARQHTTQLVNSW